MSDQYRSSSLEAAQSRSTGVGSAYAVPVAGHESAVSWGAIFAGAAGAAALSLILLILGVGLGLSSVSPWASAGVAATTFGLSTVAWLTFTQLAASGMGGYLAGRLRQKWGGVHTDETYFRDTAHGFLAWAVATLVTAGFLTSVIGAIVGSGVQAGASVAGGAMSTAAAAVGGAGAAASSDSSMGTGYFVDSLFRRDVSAGAAGAAPVSAPSTSMPMMTGGAASADASAPVPAAEVTRIFVNALRSGSALPAEDVRYVGQTVAQRTGLSQQDAERRVTEGYTRMQAKAREAETKALAAADQARKGSAYAALWLFVSLLVGAFVASLAATFGGRRRDV